MALNQDKFEYFHHLFAGWRGGKGGRGEGGKGRRGEGGKGGRGQLGNVRTRNHGRENTCTLYFSSPVQLSPDPFEDGCALEKKIENKNTRNKL